MQYLYISKSQQFKGHHQSVIQLLNSLDAIFSHVLFPHLRRLVNFRRELNSSLEFNILAEVNWINIFTCVCEYSMDKHLYVCSHMCEHPLVCE